MNAIGPQAIQRMLAQLETRAAKAPAAQGADFGSALKGALEKVSTEQAKAQELQTKFTLGDPKVGIEETMLATQQASMSFQAIVQVRNRLVSAYQDIMNMQV